MADDLLERLQLGRVDKDAPIKVDLWAEASGSDPEKLRQAVRLFAGSNLCEVEEREEARVVANPGFLARIGPKRSVGWQELYRCGELPTMSVEKASTSKMADVRKELVTYITASELNRVLPRLQPAIGDIAFDLLNSIVGGMCGASLMDSEKSGDKVLSREQFEALKKQKPGHWLKTNTAAKGWLDTQPEFAAVPPFNLEEASRRGGPVKWADDCFWRVRVPGKRQLEIWWHAESLKAACLQHLSKSNDSAGKIRVAGCERSSVFPTRR